MSMAVLLSAVLCLASAGHARRLHIAMDRVEGRSLGEQVACNQSLATLLRAFTPGAAFNSGMQHTSGPLALQSHDRVAHAPSTLPRRSPVLAKAGTVLELERAPPAPPAPPSGGEGGGDDGNGNGGSHFLRLLTPEEKMPILEDWVGRTRIYMMMDSFGGSATLAQAHSDALEKLEMLRTFDAKPSLHMLFGYFETGTEKILALAGVSVNQTRPEDQLVVSCVSPYPAELNDDDSNVVSQTLHGLRLLAATLGMTLDESALTKA